MQNQVHKLSFTGSTAGLSTSDRKIVPGNSRSTPNLAYSYNLPVITPEEFDCLHTFVQSIFDEGRQRFTMDLKTVTNDIEDCPKIHRDYLTKADALGVSMRAEGKPEEFHVWINPGYRSPVFKFYMTLAHELVHGYAGMQYGHNAHWRRWFYRTLWHLVKAEFIPAPEDELKWICISVESCYNISPTVDPMLTILEAFNRAEREHDKVHDNYFKRLGNAQSRYHI